MYGGNFYVIRHLFFLDNTSCFVYHCGMVNRTDTKGGERGSRMKALTVKDVPADLLKDVKAAGILRDQSMREVVVESLELWLKKIGWKSTPNGIQSQRGL